MHLESHEVFRATVQYGSITKAAQILHMTQSTASRHLQALEDEYGGLLLERGANGLTLTPFGKALYPYTLDLLSCHSRAKEELAALRCSGGTLAVGATMSIGEYLLPAILGQFIKIEPHIDVKMRVSNTSEVVLDLIRHRIDIGLVEGIITTEEIEVIPWKTDEIVLVCNPTHPFAQNKPIPLQALTSQVLLWREEGSGTRQVTEQAFERIGILSLLDRTMELGSTQAIKSAIEAGFGVAFLSRLTIERECALQTLVEIPIQDFTITRQLYLIERKERFPKVAVERFRKALKNL
ncbi:LysR family transcriptional regulator [Sulfoacidibacillus thermotolerans]|uniref:HTH lysR-type domain-containing protein n=1 Tax=Sulfoacidibacillus thermotolerans TaxID=1765684 RepID=A0A2U3D6T2_SULT2|nr:LysR family transcriptional regulator [Sulfoacidibacillus thermotolerans]PWI56987.1 hypothetical protein BM613_10935 [Sulfoacidibacillus thermotolerans]